MHQVMIRNMEYHWKFEIKNGTFQVETGIKNISDLLFIQTNNIPYLSPISCYSSSSASSSLGDETDRSEETGLLMHFASRSFDGLTPFMMKLLATYSNRKLDLPTSILLPNYLLFNLTLIMDQLITIYFSCYNIRSPFVHEKTFMEKYSQLDNPLEDLISLAIGTYVCSFPCNHVHFTSLDRKVMANYFYKSAYSIIIDQFDIPEKRLENVVGISLLSRYIHINLKLKEGNELIAISYQICLDLKNEFEKPPKDISNSYQYEVDRAIFSRHILITMSLRGLLNRLFNSTEDDISPPQMEWIALDDEPEETKRMIRVQNCFLGLLNRSYIQKFMVIIQVSAFSLLI